MALPVPSKEKVATLMNVLQSRKDMFRELLPKYLTAERLFRVAQLAMSKNPQILGCSPASFVIAMMDCAKSGLEPDGKHSAIIPYGTECNWQPMFQGLVKQAISGGAAKKINARVVHANDKFRLYYDPEPHLEHTPAWDDEGDIIGAYAYAILPDDSLMVEYMNKRQLDHVRAKSKSRSGPWMTDEEEMYRKTPTKRLFKYLPVPQELEYAIAADDQVESGQRREDIPLLEVVPADIQEQPKNQGEKIKAKLGRPKAAEKPQTEQPAPTPAPQDYPPPEAATDGQGPDVDELLAMLEPKGWPQPKLEIRFGKKMADWGEKELKVLADMAAE